LVLSLASIRTLAAVVETGSFAAAAARLDYSPAAVSHQMAALERSLGLTLFERGAHSIRVTDAARHLHQRATELALLLEQVHREAQLLSDGQAGRIRLGTFPSASALLLARTIARFLIRRRGVSVTIEEGEPYDLVPAITQARCDLALVFRYDLVPPAWQVGLDGDGLQATDLLVEPLHLIASAQHRLAAATEVSISDLADETWIANREPTAAHACLLACTARAGFTPDIAFTSDNFDAVLALVREGLGVAIVPGLALTRGTADIRIIPVRDSLPRRHVCALTRGGERSPLVRAFLASLTDTAAALQLTLAPVA
jgi:DNA-binding transcriptional LysR family regulator